MEILRLGSRGSEIPAVRVETGGVFALTPITDEIDGSILAGDGLIRVRDAVDAGGKLPHLLDADQLRIGTPIDRPHAIVCIWSSSVSL